MEKSIKLLAVFMLISCILISVSIIFSSVIKATTTRYYISRSPDAATVVFDNWTGKYYINGVLSNKEVDLLDGYRNDKFKLFK